MRTQFIKILCVFSVLTLLFSHNFHPLAQNYNDKRFSTYVNMGDNAVKNNYKIPHMFRQDMPYGYLEKFPLVVCEGVEYVPLSMFILYSYVEVSYSNFDDNFYLLNNRNSHFVSFNVEKDLAETHNGELMKMETHIFYQTRYVPARKVAAELGFVCETYDDPLSGIYAFRISNGKSSKTLTDLLTPYLPKPEPEPEKEPEKLPEVKPKPEDNPKPDVNKPEQNKPPKEEQPVKPEDPLEKLSPRKLGICFAGVSNVSTEKLVNTLKNHNIKASFSFTKDEMLTKPALLRQLYMDGNPLMVTANVDFEKIKTDNPNVTANQLEQLYANAFVSGLESANDAMKLVIKTKTRMCTLPYNIPDYIKNSSTFKSTLTQSGYLVYNPTVDSTDKPGYTGNAYSVSSKVKNAVTAGKETDSFDVYVLFYCSDKSQYYISDTASLINKYKQLNFVTVDEFCVFNNQGE